MAGQVPARRRRASRLHPVRLVALTVFCLLLSGVAGAAAYFFPVVVAGVGQTGQTVIIPPSVTLGAKTTPAPAASPGAPFTRSEERRVGKECRSRWSREPYKEVERLRGRSKCA